MAECTTIALRKADSVRILSGVSSCSASAIIWRPACLEYCKRSRMVAGTSAAPGSVSPSASARHCIVDAVPRKEQAPTDGHPVSL